MTIKQPYFYHGPLFPQTGGWRGTKRKNIIVATQLMEAEEIKPPKILDVAIQKVLNHFRTIFDEPKGVPPTRGYEI